VKLKETVIEFHLVNLGERLHDVAQTVASWLTQAVIHLHWLVANPADHLTSMMVGMLLRQRQKVDLCSSEL